MLGLRVGGEFTHSEALTGLKGWKEPSVPLATGIIAKWRCFAFFMHEEMKSDTRGLEVRVSHSKASKLYKVLMKGSGRLY